MAASELGARFATSILYLRLYQSQKISILVNFEVGHAFVEGHMSLARTAEKVSLPLFSYVYVGYYLVLGFRGVDAFVRPLCIGWFVGFYISLRF